MTVIQPVRNGENKIVGIAATQQFTPVEGKKSTLLRKFMDNYRTENSTYSWGTVTLRFKKIIKTKRQVLLILMFLFVKCKRQDGKGSLQHL